LEQDTKGSPRWPLLGIAAGVLSAAAFIGGTSVMGWDEGSNNVAEKLGDKYNQLILAQLAGWMALAALLVFGAGFYRLMQSRLPQSSMLGMVAGAAMLATVGAGIIGYGSMASAADSLPGNRLYFFEVEDPDLPLDEQSFPAEVKSTAYYDASNAICYAWIGVCAAAGATAVAVFRHKVFPRWIGFFSAFIGIIMTAFLVAGLPFGAAFWAPLWLIVMGIALAVKAPAWSREPAPALT